MSLQLQRTCWHDLEVAHPPDWELVTASGPNEPGRLTFADRRYQRLDLRWRPIQYKPNLSLLLDKHRQETDPQDRPRKLTTAPAPWQGLVRSVSGATVVHAGRFFPDTGWLVEGMLLWPKARQRGLENAVLRSVAPRVAGERALWQAMGLSLEVSREYALAAMTTHAGRIRWELAAGPGRGSRITVERLAVPDYWVPDSLGNWLQAELPEGTQVLHEGRATVNGHVAAEVIADISRGILRRFRRSRRVQISRAWRCPTENRAYHVAYAERRQDDAISLPKHLTVFCCGRAAAPVSAGEDA